MRLPPPAHEAPLPPWCWCGPTSTSRGTAAAPRIRTTVPARVLGDGVPEA
ncbi:hypothetical protein [Microbispora catharanthi]|nr:hypothetical protein [Microbispora catharanthi]